MSFDPEEAELRRKLISGAKWTTVLRVLAQAFSWLVNIIVVRFLSPEDYGLNAMLEVPIELLMLFSMVGMDMALVQKHKSSDEELSAVFGLLLLVNGGFFLILLFGAGTIAGYFGEPRLVPLIQVTAAIFLLSPFRVIPNALLDRELAFKLKAQVELAAAVASSLISLSLAVLGAGVWALVAAVVGNFVLRAALLAYLKPWIVRPSLRFSLVKGLLRYGGIITFSMALVVLAGKALTMIAGPIVGAEALGYFSVAYTFALLALSKLMPIVQQTMYPAFAQLEGKPELARAYLMKSIEVTSMVTVPISVGIACVSFNFVVTIFGQAWQTVALPLLLLSLTTPLRMVTNLLGPPLNALGHAKAMFWVNGSMFCMVVAGSYPAASFGLMGLVALWMVVVAVTMLVALATARVRIGITAGQVLQAASPSLISSAIMATPLLIANILAPGTGVLRLLAECTIGAAVYFTAMRLLFRPQFDTVHAYLSKH